MHNKWYFAFIISLFFWGIPLHAQVKKTVCLNMIVKNEKDVITRCLKSVRPIIDYWVIVDTGSTDGTQEIIKEYMKDIPGELHERPWKNFEHNRNEALDLAQGKADYCLVMDADDILVFDKDFILPELTADGYFIKVSLGNIVFDRVQLFKLNKPWRWKGVLHETLGCPPPCNIINLPHVTYKDTREGARSRDPKTYAKDAAILEEALKKEPNNSRYMFYLAQSYKDAHEYQKSIDCYETRIAMGDWDQEVYWSMLQVAELKKSLGKPSGIIFDDYFRAYRYRPQRAEALYGLADMLNKEHNFALSYALLKTFPLIPKPQKKDYLFLQEWMENWGLQFQLSIAAYYLGFYQEALLLNDELLRRDDLTEYFRALIIKNRTFAEKKVREMASAPVNA